MTQDRPEGSGAAGRPDADATAHVSFDKPGPGGPDPTLANPYQTGPYGGYGYTTDDHDYPPAGYPEYPPAGYPQSGYPQPGYPQPGYGYPPAAAPTNGMAIAALVCGIVVPPVGIVLGMIARKQIRATGESGDGIALAGVIVGATLSVLFVLMFILPFVLLFAFAGVAGGWH